MTNYEQIGACFSNARPDSVILIASAGMSGKAMLSAKTERINLDGVRYVINACRNFSVKRLLYTSTYNAVFGGQKIENGTEDLPYYPAEGYTDYYSRSKRLAEELILQANTEDKLLTMALRPNAIYGPGEVRHFTRVVHHMDAGLFSFRIGSAVTDWLHIDNLVDAFVKALQCMEKGKGGGEAYFISDGSPIDPFEFFRPICESRHTRFPNFVISVGIAQAVAWLLERCYYILEVIVGPELAPAPFLTQTEVLKVGVTHYMDISKARRDLGYNPKISSQQGAAEMGKIFDVVQDGQLRPGAFKNYFRLSATIWWVLIVYAMSALHSIAYHSPDEMNSVCYAWSDRFGSRAVMCPLLEQTGLFLFRSRSVLQFVFKAATLAHAFEACVAYRLCQKHGVGVFATTLWVTQTFILGYPSLSLLLNHFREIEQKATDRSQSSPRDYDPKRARDTTADFELFKKKSKTH
eukprot:TRINITY_DN52036_c0_g1_i1.p1 TRINITY_DN52036_c0_g1~~TRINITY_DN52036_c0_g1_i1.p1  ORF type:complete len:526 (+),score=48.97 TRINITY_DN52036_c0_g1_i1:188-1579(+)